MGEPHPPRSPRSRGRGRVRLLMRCGACPRRASRVPPAVSQRPMPRELQSDREDHEPPGPSGIHGRRDTVCSPLRARPAPPHRSRTRPHPPGDDPPTRPRAKRGNPARSAGTTSPAPRPLRRCPRGTAMRDRAESCGRMNPPEGSIPPLRSRHHDRLHRPGSVRERRSPVGGGRDLGRPADPRSPRGSQWTSPPWNGPSPSPSPSACCSSTSSSSRATRASRR